MVRLVQDSDEPATYIHVTPEQVKQSELRRRGLSPGSPTPTGALQAVACSGCGAANPATHDYCGRCRLPTGAASRRTPEVQRRELMEMLAAEVARQVKSALPVVTPYGVSSPTP